MGWDEALGDSGGEEEEKGNIAFALEKETTSWEKNVQAAKPGK